MSTSRSVGVRRPPGERGKRSADARSASALCSIRSASARAASTNCASFSSTSACSGVFVRWRGPRRPRGSPRRRPSCSAAARCASRRCTGCGDTAPFRRSAGRPGSSSCSRARGRRGWYGVTGGPPRSHRAVPPPASATSRIFSAPRRWLGPRASRQFSGSRSRSSARRGRLAVGGGEDDLLAQRLHVPAALQNPGEPVEQFRVGRRLRPGSRNPLASPRARCRRTSPRSGSPPPARQRVVRSGEPLRQAQPVARAVLGEGEDGRRGPAPHASRPRTWARRTRPRQHVGRRGAAASPPSPGFDWARPPPLCSARPDRRFRDGGIQRAVNARSSVSCRRNFWSSSVKVRVRRDARSPTRDS